jgi:hypothetical protein
VSQRLGSSSTKKKLFLAAGAIAVAVSLLLFAGGLFVPEIASQTLFSLTPYGSQLIFSYGSQLLIHSKFKHCGKSKLLSLFVLI